MLKVLRIIGRFTSSLSRIKQVRRLTVQRVYSQLSRQLTRLNPKVEPLQLIFKYNNRMRAKAANALSRETAQRATSLLGGPTQPERSLLGIMTTTMDSMIE